MLAQLYGRSLYAIKLIYTFGIEMAYEKWQSIQYWKNKKTGNRIKKKNPNNVHLLKVRRIAKEEGVTGKVSLSTKKAEKVYIDGIVIKNGQNKEN